MNENQAISLRKLFDLNLLRAIGRAFGGKPKIHSADSDNVTVAFEQVDSGNEWMTYGDVSAFTGADLDTVRYWARARTRANAKYPFPETIDLAGPRVKRSELVDWWARMQGK